ETDAMGGSAPPRNPLVPMCVRSSNVRSFDVACRSRASRASSGDIPEPSSVTSRRAMPPPSTSTVTRRAPASSAFSTSSLAADAGRSTTSPAAIWSTRASSRTRTSPGTCGMLAALGGRRLHHLLDLGDLARRRARQALRPVFRDEDVVLDPHAEVPPFRVHALALLRDVDARLDGENHALPQLRHGRGVARPPVRLVGDLVAPRVVHVEAEPVRRAGGEERRDGAGLDALLARPLDEAELEEAVHDDRERRVLNLVVRGAHNRLR